MSAELKEQTKPYYSEAGIEIFCGDARELLSVMPQPDTCITDPAWPNSVFNGVSNPQQLFGETCERLTSERLIVHLGCTSDPRFLMAVPARLRNRWYSHDRSSFSITRVF